MTAAAPAGSPSLVVTALAQRPDEGGSHTLAVAADMMRVYGSATP